MGAGVSKNGQPQLANNCIDCNRKFNPITRRKKACSECNLLICQECSIANGLPAEETARAVPSSQTNSSITNTIVKCKSCLILLSRDPTYDTLISLKTRHLKEFLRRHNVSDVETCIEKRHLVELILERFGGSTYQQDVEERRNRSVLVGEELNDVHPLDGEPESNTEQTENQQTRSAIFRAPEPNQTEQSVPTQNNSPEETDSSKSKISLNEIENKDEIDNLTVKQLKIILTNNFVDYRGCKEKHELITKVKMLWDSRQANKRLYEKLLNPAVDGKNVPGALEEPELCKICMDATIDCVLLECGHMVTCTQCGKQMNECPICRQFVIRAVHIFRA